MVVVFTGPSPNHSKMSVTNEDVSGGAHNMTGEGGTTPTAPIPRQTVTSSASSSTLGSTTSPGVTSVVATPTSLNNGMSSGDDVAKSGYLRKLKGKKKFFVLRKETDADKPARLEYYAKEKNFRMGHPPRKYVLHFTHYLHNSLSRLFIHSPFILHSFIQSAKHSTCVFQVL